MLAGSAKFHMWLEARMTGVDTFMQDVLHGVQCPGKCMPNVMHSMCCRRYCILLTDQAWFGGWTVVQSCLHVCRPSMPAGILRLDVRYRVIDASMANHSRVFKGHAAQDYDQDLKGIRESKVSGLSRSEQIRGCCKPKQAPVLMDIDNLVALAQIW